MKASEYLGRARKAAREAEKMRERVMNLRMLTTDTSVHLTGMPGRHSSDQQKMLTLLAEIDSLEREIAEAEKRLSELRIEIGMMICKINNPIAQKVLMLYYLENKNCNEIADVIKYGKSQVYRYRDDGYKELEELLNE